MRGGVVTQSQILLTGGSGYIATLLAAALIETTDCGVIAAVRSPRSLFDLEDRVSRELSPARQRELRRRFRAVCLAAAGPRSFAACLRENDISELIHCAGSVDYANAQKLTAANVELTRQWLDAARTQGVSRFVHISTAFSAGSNGDALIPESLHPEPASEPTVYTKTKRESERLVAASGIPFLIVRPSILVGDSRDGRYHGKAYGLYQFWKSAERFLSDFWRPHLHVVAPLQPLPLLHQDHFQSAFAAALRHAVPNSIIHLVSEDAPLPTCRDVWNFFAAERLKPDSVTFYDTLEQVPLSSLDRGNRAFLKAIATNVAISAHRWQFETTQLARLRNQGCEFPRATLQSLAACQRAFLAGSALLAQGKQNQLNHRNMPVAHPPSCHHG